MVAFGRGSRPTEGVLQLSIAGAIASLRSTEAKIPRRASAGRADRRSAGPFSIDQGESAPMNPASSRLPCSDQLLGLVVFRMNRGDHSADGRSAPSGCLLLAVKPPLRPTSHTHRCCRRASSTDYNAGKKVGQAESVTSLELLPRRDDPSRARRSAGRPLRAGRTRFDGRKRDPQATLEVGCRQRLDGGDIGPRRAGHPPRGERRGRGRRVRGDVAVPVVPDAEPLEPRCRPGARSAWSRDDPDKLSLISTRTSFKCWRTEGPTMTGGTLTHTHWNRPERLRQVKFLSSQIFGRRESRGDGRPGPCLRPRVAADRGPGPSVADR